MRSQDDNKKKFVNIFTRVNVLLAERKKETSKTYFKKISVKRVLLILSLISIVNIFYFEFLRYANPISYPNIQSILSPMIVLFVPLIVMMILTVLITTPLFNKIVYYTGIPLLLVGYIIFYFVSIDSYFRFLALILIGYGIGIVFGIVISLFLFSFDMSERLITCLTLLFILFSYSFFNNSSLPSVVKLLIVPSIVAIVAYVCLLISNFEEVVTVERRNEAIPKYSIFILIFLLWLICMNQGVNGAIEMQFHPNGIGVAKTYYSTTYYIGFILSFIVSIFVFLYAKKSIIFMLMIYLVGLFGAYQLTIFNLLYDEKIVFWRQAADVAFGFSNSTGYLVALMMTGKILEDKASKGVLFYTIICYTCFIVASYFISRAFMHINLKSLSIEMLILTTIFMVLFVIFNLLGYFEKKIVKDTPVGNIESNQNKYKNINPNEILTPKEKVVFDLLLEGMTLRQIAGELAMKYDSVNFHYKNIYRKLKVNSKIELIIRYGGEK